MYYKRIEKHDYFYINAPIALEKSYETLKSKKDVIVSSDDNGEFLLVPTPMLDEFVPTTISRQDLISRGFDPSELSNEQMQEIAYKMGGKWVGFGNYWEEMDACAEEFGLTESEKEEE